MRCHMLMLNVPSSLLSRRQCTNVTHRKVWTVLTFYNVLTFKPIHIVCRFLKSPNPNQTSQLVLFPLLIKNFYNKNVLSLLGSHSSETMHSIRQSSSFRNSRLNKKNWTKRILTKVGFELSKSWSLSNCFNCYTTGSTVSVVSFKLHLLHAPLFFSLVPLIYLIERKCLNFEKTRMIFMGFTLLNVKGLAKSCFLFGTTQRQNSECTTWKPCGFWYTIHSN